MFYKNVSVCRCLLVKLVVHFITQGKKKQKFSNFILSLGSTIEVKKKRAFAKKTKTISVSLLLFFFNFWTKNVSVIERNQSSITSQNCLETIETMIPHFFFFSFIKFFLLLYLFISILRILFYSSMWFYLKIFHFYSFNHTE